ncbi:DUF2799 domain-containing protein [Vibrio mimicus]|nr:DUF2799 domain-containing protein [Vibrio mimicus]
MMKKLLWVVLLSGCATVEVPPTGSPAAWEAFGQQQGEQGKIKLTQAQMLKQDEQQLMDEQLYQAYSQGYEQGRQQYCQQSAYLLGVSGKYYLGVCDDINIWFRQDYASGRHSTAGEL